MKKPLLLNTIILHALLVACNDAGQPEMASPMESRPKITVSGQVNLIGALSSGPDYRLNVEILDISDPTDVPKSVSHFLVVRLDEKTIFPVEYEHAYEKGEIRPDGVYVLRATISDRSGPFIQKTHSTLVDHKIDMSRATYDFGELTVFPVSREFLSTSSSEDVFTYLCGEEEIAVRFAENQAFALTPVGVVALDKIRDNEELRYVSQHNHPEYKHAFWQEGEKIFFEYYGALLGECETTD